MAGNGYDLSDGADIVFEDGEGNSYGFKYANATGMTESRGAAFAPSVTQTEQSYQDAEPFKRAVFRDTTGGMGQMELDRSVGGYGAGGDATKFLASNGHTLQPAALMPGIARVPHILSTTVVTQISPIPQDWETPRGVIPICSPNGAIAQFAALNSNNVSGIDVMCYVGDLPKAYSYDGGIVSPTIPTVQLEIQDENNAAYHAYFKGAAASARYGFKWVQLTPTTSTWVGAGSNFVPSPGHRYRFIFTSSTGNNKDITFGGFARWGLSALSGYELTQPYVRAKGSLISGNPFNHNIEGKGYIKVGSTKVGITQYYIFNADGPTIKLSNINTGFVRPFEYWLTYKGDLYLFAYDLLYKVAGTEISGGHLAAGTAVATTTAISGGPPLIIGGKMYFVSKSNGKMYRWDGVAAPVEIISTPLWGDSAYPVNNMFIYNGQVYLVKTDGVWTILDDLTAVTTAEAPIVRQVFDHQGILDYSAGTYLVQHKGIIYYNCGNSIFGLTITNSTGAQVVPIAPSEPLNPDASNLFCNGLASDGNLLYAYWTGLGVMAWNDKGWHMVSESYKVDLSIASGLTMFTDLYNGYNQLYFCDSDVTVKQPIASPFQPFSSTFALSDQNQCFFHVTSVWDGDYAEIIKYLKSVTLYSNPGAYTYKVVAALWETGDTSYDATIHRALRHALTMDKFSSDPFSHISGLPVVIYNHTSYNSANFFNSYSLSEQDVVDSLESLTNSFTTVSCAFIIIGFDSQQTHFSAPLDNKAAYLRGMSVKFLPIQDYVPAYSCTLDLQAMTHLYATQEDPTEDPLEVAVPSSVGRDMAWLRGRFGAHRPTKIRFYGPDGDVAEKFIFFTKNPISFGALTDVQTTGNTATYKVILQMISCNEEYKGY